MARRLSGDSKRAQTATHLIWVAETLRRSAPSLAILLALGLVVRSVLTPLELLALRKLVGTAELLVSHIALDPTADPGALRFSLLLWAALLALVAYAHTGFRIVQRLGNFAARERVNRYLFHRIAKKCARMPLERIESAEFHDMLENARRAADGQVAQVVEELFNCSVQVLSAASLLMITASIHPVVPALLCATAPVMLWSYLRGNENVWKMYRGHSPEVRRARYLEELLTGRKSAQEVRLFQLREHLVQRWREHILRMRREQLALLRRNEGRKVLGSLCPPTVAVLGTWLILRQIGEGLLGVSDYVMLTAALLRFGGHVDEAMWTAARVRQRLLACGDLRELLDQSEEAPPENPKELPASPAEIRFEEVSFRYPGASEWVFRRLNLVLRPAECVALVGPNGAGKSTLAKLLLGLYRPSKGRITVGGVDLQEVPPNARFRAMAAIFQDFVRYELTLAENVGFGKIEEWEAGAQARERAAALAGIEPLVERLPKGWETLLGKAFGETDLSGGEWQKVAIARALVSDAGIVVLDEPTAALDPVAEAKLYADFAEVARGRTVVLISHRLASARLADRVIVLQSGEIVEEGRHDELVAQDGPYAAMFRAQAAWYGDEWRAASHA